MKNLYFIIPVYNVERYIHRCIRSVLEQTYERVGIILVDDGSPDGCPEICDEYARMYKNIHVIHKENGGLSDARNVGLTLALKTAGEDDYISFLDSDDFIRSDYAEKMIAICEGLGCDIAQCGYEKGEDGVFSDTENNPRVYETDSEKALLGYDLKSFACAKIFRCGIFKDIRFPDGVWNEDEFTVYRAVYNAHKTAFTSERLYYYFQHSGSIMDNIAKRLKNNPHRYDWLKAYKERIDFFIRENKPLQVLRTREKICTDIILRYNEQMRLNAKERDTDCVSGKYIEIYRSSYKSMIKRHGIPIKRRIVYALFYVAPYSAVIIGRIFTLRK